MKTLKITLLCCFIAITATAQTIITIDNSPESTTTYQNLQDALDAAASGDIIYVQPTGTSYGNGNIEKPITIVGRSHSEDNRISRVAAITVRSSDVTIKGLTLSSYSTNATGPNTVPYTNINIYECEVSTIFLGTSASTAAIPYVSDIEIQGNVIGSVNQNTDAANILISNNIITSSLLTRNPNTVVVSNNIFRAPGGNFSLQNTSATATAIFFNNMFIVNSASNRTITLNTGDFNFSNTLTYNYGLGDINFSTSGGATFLENNSLLNTDPLFVDVDATTSQSLAGTSSYNASTREDDLTLQAGSPALTGGGGGDQIGLFNGGFNYNYVGNPRDIPILDIINYDAAVPKNGTINVTVKAKAN